MSAWNQLAAASAINGHVDTVKVRRAVFIVASTQHLYVAKLASGSEAIPATTPRAAALAKWLRFTPATQVRRETLATWVRGGGWGTISGKPIDRALLGRIIHHFDDEVLRAGWLDSLFVLRSRNPNGVRAGVMGLGVSTVVPSLELSLEATS